MSHRPFYRGFGALEMQTLRTPRHYVTRSVVTSLLLDVRESRDTVRYAKHAFSYKNMHNFIMLHHIELKFGWHPSRRTAYAARKKSR